MLTPNAIVVYYMCVNIGGLIDQTLAHFPPVGFFIQRSREMAKDEKQRQRTAFFNVKLPEMVQWAIEPDCPQTELELFTEFAELSEEGVKVSFGAKKERNGYSVSVTLPEVGVAFDAVCCSFWGGDRFEAWLRAYAVVFVFGAYPKGWDYAQEEIDKTAKKLKEEMQASRRTK